MKSLTFSIVKVKDKHGKSEKVLGTQKKEKGEWKRK